MSTVSSNDTIPIWLAVHAVTCWWNDRPIKGGSIDIGGLEAMLIRVMVSGLTPEEKVAYFEARVKGPSDAPKPPASLAAEGGSEGAAALEYPDTFDRWDWLRAAFVRGAQWQAYQPTKEERVSGKPVAEGYVKTLVMEVFPPDTVNDGCPWYSHTRSAEDSAAKQMVRHLIRTGRLSPAAPEGKVLTDPPEPSEDELMRMLKEGHIIVRQPSKRLSEEQIEQEAMTRMQVSERLGILNPDDLGPYIIGFKAGGRWANDLLFPEAAEDAPPPPIEEHQRPTPPNE